MLAMGKCSVDTALRDIFICWCPGSWAGWRLGGGGVRGICWSNRATSQLEWAQAVITSDDNQSKKKVHHWIKRYFSFRPSSHLSLSVKNGLSARRISVTSAAES